MKLFMDKFKKEVLKEKEKETKFLKETIIILQKQMEEQGKTVLELINKVGNITNTTNNNSHNNTINNNITVLSYKDTDYNSVMSQLNKSINGYTGKIELDKFIKIVHLNPKAPQNHNLFIENSNEKRIMIFNGDDVEEYGRGFNGIETLCNEILDYIDEREEFTSELKDAHCSTYDDLFNRDINNKDFMLIYTPLYNGRERIKDSIKNTIKYNK